VPAVSAAHVRRRPSPTHPTGCAPASRDSLLPPRKPATTAGAPPDDARRFPRQIFPCPGQPGRPAESRARLSSPWPTSDQPYGGGALLPLAGPPRGDRPDNGRRRRSGRGALFCMLSPEPWPGLYVERGGKTLLSWTDGPAASSCAQPWRAPCAMGAIGRIHGREGGWRPWSPTTHR